MMLASALQPRHTGFQPKQPTAIRPVHSARSDKRRESQTGRLHAEMAWEGQEFVVLIDRRANRSTLVAAQLTLAEPEQQRPY
jgi:hypothetical protein